MLIYSRYDLSDTCIVNAFSQSVACLFTFLMISLDELFCMCAKSLQSCLTLCDPVDCSLPGYLCPLDSPGKNTEVGCHFLLQGIFLTQGPNKPVSSELSEPAYAYSVSPEYVFVSFSSLRGIFPR